MRHRALTALFAVAASGLVASSAQATTLAAGAGAEYPAAAFREWCADSHACTYDERDHPRVALGELSRGQVAWVGEDDRLTPSERREAGGPVAYYPVLAAAVAVAVNIPGVDGTRMRLDSATLGDMFAGTVRTWGDRRLVGTNHKLHLPSKLPITLCVPAGESSESQDFSQYLARTSTTFRRRVGGDIPAPHWRAPTVVRVPEPELVGECMEAHPGAITFLAMGDAVREGLTRHVAAVGRRQWRATVVKGRKRMAWVGEYLRPTETRVAAAAAGSQTLTAGDLTADLTHVNAPNAYPIVCEAYVVVRRDRPMSKDVRTTLTYFLGDAAQSELDGLGYVRLPASVIGRARAQLAAAR